MWVLSFSLFGVRYLLLSVVVSWLVFSFRYVWCSLLASFSLLGNCGKFFFLYHWFSVFIRFFIVFLRVSGRILVYQSLGLFILIRLAYIHFFPEIISYRTKHSKTIRKK